MGQEFAGRSAVVVCYRGAKLAQGAAAWLRQLDVPAETLEAGSKAGKREAPTDDISKLPPPRREGTYGLG